MRKKTAITIRTLQKRAFLQKLCSLSLFATFAFIMAASAQQNCVSSEAQYLWETICTKGVSAEDRNRMLLMYKKDPTWQNRFCSAFFFNRYVICTNSGIFFVDLQRNLINCLFENSFPTTGTKTRYFLDTKEIIIYRNLNTCNARLLESLERYWDVSPRIFACFRNVQRKKRPMAKKQCRKISTFWVDPKYPKHTYVSVFLGRRKLLLSRCRRQAGCCQRKLFVL